MESYVKGVVIAYYEEPEPVNIVVKCSNGKLVSVDINEPYLLLPTGQKSGFLGKEVEIEGEALFVNGEIRIFASTVAELDSSGRVIKESGGSNRKNRIRPLLNE